LHTAMREFLNIKCGEVSAENEQHLMEDFVESFQRTVSLLAFSKRKGELS